MAHTIQGQAKKDRVSSVGSNAAFERFGGGGGEQVRARLIARLASRHAGGGIDAPGAGALFEDEATESVPHTPDSNHA